MSENAAFDNRPKRTAPFCQHAVSNIDMPRMVSSLILALLACSVWGQHTYSKKMEQAAIERVKTTQVSSLDRGLPKVTLEVFLSYEGEGAPIKWRMSTCGQVSGNRAVEREQTAAKCVEADIDLKGDRSATIVISVGTVKTGAVDVPAFFSATVSDRDGTTHAVRRLGDLPMGLHRPLPRWPRDLPLPAGAALVPLAAATNHHA